MHKQLCALGILAAVVIPSLAQAGTITIGVQEDGVGPIQQLSGGSVFSAGFTTADFVVTNANGTTQSILPSPGLLFSGNTSVSGGGTGAHFLDVWITAQGLNAPLGTPLQVLSGLTQNLLTTGWTTTLSTFLSSTNMLFTGTPLDSANLSTTMALASINPANTGTGPYSVTAEYQIFNHGFSGVSDATIDTVAVPGPIVGAGLPGLIAACGGLLALARRRRNKAAPV